MKGLVKKDRKKQLRESFPFYILLLPALIIVFLMNYLPIYGVLIAFQDFMPGDKILSDTTIWLGFKNFTRFFKDVQFWPLMTNTFLLCIEGFIIGFPLPIIVALMLNSLKNKKFGKYLQTIFTMPHFISLVVLVGIIPSDNFHHATLHLPCCSCWYAQPLFWPLRFNQQHCNKHGL